MSMPPRTTVVPREAYDPVVSSGDRSALAPHAADPFTNSDTTARSSARVAPAEDVPCIDAAAADSRIASQTPSIASPIENQAEGNPLATPIGAGEARAV